MEGSFERKLAEYEGLISDCPQSSQKRSDARALLASFYPEPSAVWVLFKWRSKEPSIISQKWQRELQDAWSSREEIHVDSSKLAIWIQAGV